MTTTQAIAIAVGAVVLIGYPIFMRLLAQLMQPSRLKMADIGKSLLDHPDVSSEHKLLISSTLDDAYSPAFMIVLVVVMPIFGPLALLGFGLSLPPLNDPYARQLFDEFSNRYSGSISAANPLFTLIAAIEMAILTIVLFPLGQLSRAQSVQFGSMQMAEHMIGRVLRRAA